LNAGFNSRWHEIHRNDPSHDWLRDAHSSATKEKELNDVRPKTGAMPNPRR
jgi:hypothetical protein